jgi:hypothetical protein
LLFLGLCRSGHKKDGEHRAHMRAEHGHVGMPFQTVRYSRHYPRIGQVSGSSYFADVGL